MAIQKGVLVLLKSGANTIASCRAVSFTVNGEIVDVTNADSAGQRELLAGAGVSSMSISIEGLFSEDAEQVEFLTRAFDRTLNAYTIVFGSTLDTLAGNFQVTSFESGGEYNGAQTFSATLESSGTVTYTDVL